MQDQTTNPTNNSEIEALTIIQEMSVLHAHLYLLKEIGDFNFCDDFNKLRIEAIKNAAYLALISLAKDLDDYDPKYKAQLKEIVDLIDNQGYIPLGLIIYDAYSTEDGPLISNIAKDALDAIKSAALKKHGNVLPFTSLTPSP